MVRVSNLTLSTPNSRGGGKTHIGPCDSHICSTYHTSYILHIVPHMYYATYLIYTTHCTSCTTHRTSSLLSMAHHPCPCLPPGCRRCPHQRAALLQCHHLPPPAPSHCVGHGRGHGRPATLSLRSGGACAWACVCVCVCVYAWAWAYACACV